MKVLEVDSLQDGIEYAIKDIERVNVQLLDIENAVKHFSSLDDELTGQGGDAIRAFYRDCHLPFLEFFQESLEEFSEILMQMSQAVNSFESNKSGHVKEDYLENDVIDGLDTVETTTTALTAEANSIIESVQDLVAINKIDETEVIENVQRGRIKSNETVEELHALDESQVQALSPVLDRLRTMKQYVTELDSKFKRADLSVTSYDVNGVKDIGPLKAINPQLYANLDNLNARLFQDGSYQFGRALDAIDSAAMMGEARPELVTSPLDLELKILKGIGTGAVDVVVDTVTGVFDMVTNPVETLESMWYMITNPIDTGKYMAQAVKDSFVRDVINGDAESRAHWFTYAAGTIAGTKGVSSGIKSTRMGSNALRNAKDIANKAGDIKVPNLSPFNPQHQLAPVGPVPYNVYDGYNLRDQLLMKAEKFSAGGKSNRDVGGTGNVSPDVIRKVENNILDKMESVGGHTLERHVGKTNEDLIKRAIQENVEAATSFTDKSIATKAIQENLRKNADAIEEWLNKSDTGRMVFDVSHKNPIGKGALEDKKQVIYDLTNSRVVLIRDTTNELGFRILTGFPVVK